MENDVVFTNKMHQFGVFVFPVIFPVFALIQSPLLGSGNVANRSIEPHVEHFSIGTFDRHGNAPIQITRHGTRFQSAINPRHTLANYLISPSFRVVLYFSIQNAFLNPRTQPVFVLVHRQKPMFRFF